MSRERPLSRSRLHEILDRFEPGVRMEMVGGYDTGVYFAFKGRRIRRPGDERIVGGRLVDDHGFCSEALIMTHAEQFSRGGTARGIGLFFARCAEREARFARWLADFETKRTTGETS